MQQNGFDEVLSAILDEENSDKIILANESQTFEYEQIAVIPRNEELYVILKPVTPIEGVDEDEGLVFLIDEEQKAFRLVVDEKIIDEVFDVYFSLIEVEDDE